MVKSVYRPYYFYEILLKVAAYTTALFIISECFPFNTSENIHAFIFSCILPLAGLFVWFFPDLSRIAISNEGITVYSITGKNSQFTFEEITKIETSGNINLINVFNEPGEEVLRVTSKDGTEIYLSTDIHANYLELKEQLFNNIPAGIICQTG